MTEIIQEEEITIEDMDVYDESIENFEEDFPEDPEFDKDELEIETD